MGMKNWYRLLFDSAFRKEKEEEYKNLTFTDDFIFYRVMQNETLCKKLLEVILKVKVKTIRYHETQKFFKSTYMSKGIRLDMYVEDEDNTVYDVEMQPRSDAYLPKRSRYYQGVIDVEKTPKGIKYKDLKKSYIIFLCLKDMFGKGRYIYTFENICLEDKNLRLNDGTQKVFLNASAFEKASDSGIKAFLSYMNDSIPVDEFTRELEEEVKAAKNSNRWRKSYMTLAMKYEEKYEEGRQEGIQEGIQEDHNQSIEKLARKYMSENDGLSYEEAYKMAEQVLR